MTSHHLPRPVAAAPVRAGLVVAVVLSVLIPLLAVVTAPPARAEAGVGERPVVLVGAPGLAWSDVTEAVAPTLYGLSERDDAATGSLVVRSVRAASCPADGWLAISAGNRAGDTPPGDLGGCRVLEEPGPDGVPGWSDMVARAQEASFTALPGLLGDRLAEAGVTSTAIGPGAALALSESSGEVPVYEELDPDALSTQVADGLAAGDVVVVDAGTVRPTPGANLVPTRADAVHAADAAVAAALSGAGASGRDPVVILSGVADASSVPALRYLATVGLGGGELSSPSTRQLGYVLATDQHASVLQALGLETGGTSAIGAAMAASPGSTNRAAAAVDRADHAEAARPLIPGFFLTLVIVNLLLYAAVAIGLRRSRWARSGIPPREPVLHGLRLVSLAIASLPVASFLTNLLPWWRADPPVLALAGGIAAWVAVIVLVSLAGPWRSALLGPAAVVGAITAVVLAVDVVTGARLQVSAIMGIPTLVAGRFYGMNNTAFALFTVALLVLTTAIANSLVLRGRRRLAALVVAVIGVVAVVIDGAPALGADFGGPPALLPAFALLALLAAGIRLNVLRVVAVVAVSAVATLGIAFVDWLRPAADRTHLGRFLQDVLDGSVWPVVYRKLDQNLSILFGNRPLTILAICGVLLVVFVLVRPVRRTVTSPEGGEFGWLSGGAPISAMADETPMLGPGLVSLAVAVGIGFAVNDSGIAIPANGVAVAVPLLLATCASWMLRRPDQLAAESASPDGVVPSAVDGDSSEEEPVPSTVGSSPAGSPEGATSDDAASADSTGVARRGPSG